MSRAERPLYLLATAFRQARLGLPYDEWSWEKCEDVDWQRARLALDSLTALYRANSR